MTYRAGDVEAKLTLDRTPFAEGLRLAIQEGEDFARQKFTATADVKVNTADLDRLERRVKDFADRKYTGKIDVDVSGNVRLDALIRKLDEFGKKTYIARVDVDTTAANAKLDELQARLGALDTTVTVRVRYRPDRLPPVPVPPGGGPGGGPTPDIDINQGRLAARIAAAVKEASAALPKIDIDANSSPAERKLADIRAQMVALGEKKIGVDISAAEAMAKLKALQGELNKLNRKSGDDIRIKVDTAAAMARIAALRAEIDGLGKAGASGGGGFPLLPVLIGGALTMIGPLAAAGTAALLGTVGAAGTLGAAFLGLKEDIKAGADETKPLLSQVGAIKTEAEGLGHTAEHAIMGGLMGSLRQVRAFLPTMDPVVARLGIGLGSVAEHLTGALTTTLTKSTPLMISFVDLLDRGAANVQKFVASDKFSQFLAYAEQELPKVVSDLGDFTSGATELIVAFQPIGDALLSTIALFGRGVHAAKEFGDAVNHNVHSTVDPLDNFGKGVNNRIRGLFGVGPQDAPKVKAGPTQDDIQAAQVIATQVALARLNDTGKLATATIAGLAHTYGVSDKAIIGYAASVGIADGALKAGSVSQRAYTADVTVVAQANRTGTASTMAYVAAMEAFAKSEGTAADRATLIAAALKQANGDLLGYANTQAAAAVANQTFVSSMTDAARKTVNLRTGLINYRDAASGPLLTNLQALQDAAAKAAGATYQHELSTKGAAAASKHAADQYYAQTHGALIDEASQLGLTKAQATRLADQYLALPRDIKTRIAQIGADPVVNVLNMIGKQLSFLTGKPWVSTVQAPVGPAMANLNKVQSLLRATTGNKTLTVVADVSRAYRSLSSFLSSPATKVVQVVTVSPHGVFGGRQVTNAYGNVFKANDSRVKHYGYGGVEDQPNNHQPAIYPVRPSGAVRVFAEPETQGEAYVPLANDHRRPRAQAIVQETARVLGGAAYFATGGGYGFDNVKGPAAPKRRVGGAGGGSTANPNTAAKKAAAKKAAAAKAARTAAKSLGNTVFTELAGIGTLATGTAAHVNAATIAIQASVRKAFALHFTDSALVRSVNTETAALRKAVNERVVTAAKLSAATSALNTTKSNMAQDKANVANNILGRFDIGTSGNGYKYGIQATLTQDLADAKKFAALRTQAEKLGLDKRLVKQITEEGPQVAGRNLEAIVAGGAGYVKTLNSLYGQFNTVAQGVGAAQAKDDFGVLFAKQSETVNKLTREQTAETKKINHEVALLRADVVRLSKQLAARGR